MRGFKNEMRRKKMKQLVKYEVVNIALRPDQKRTLKIIQGHQRCRFFDTTRKILNNDHQIPLLNNLNYWSLSLLLYRQNLSP